MRCNPLRWLWGLIPLAMLGFVAYLTLPKEIERELAERANTALSDAKVRWTAIAFSGRDAVLTGRASDDEQRQRAVNVVANVPGVHRVVDRMTALELVRNYVWSASLNKGHLRLEGFVPSETARKAILGTAKASFPGVQFDDRTKLARGAPDQGRWLAAVTFALKQLSALNNGARVDLEGLALTVTGEAQSAPEYRRIKLDLENALPSGLRLKENRVRAPVVKPYTWAATRRGQQVELSGHVPSDGQLKQIVAAAKQAFRGLTVVDHMGIARGEPQGWQAAVLSALARLAELKNGQADLEDLRLRVTGYAETMTEVERIRQALRKGLPSGFTLEAGVEQDPAARAREAALRQETERRAAEEAKRRAEVARKAEEEARQKAEETPRDQERRAAEAAKRKADEEARRLAAAEEAQRTAQDKAAAEREAARRQLEAERRLIAEERRRRAAEERSIVEREVQANVAVARRRAEEGRCVAQLTEAARAGAVNFDWASAAIDPDSRQRLARLAAIAKSCPDVVIELGGHADAEGLPDRKQRLSEQRARVAADFLIKAGIPQSQIRTAGYADKKPVASNQTDEGRAKNRRVEITVKPK